MSALEEKTKNSEINGIHFIARSAAMPRTLCNTAVGLSVERSVANIDLPTSKVQRNVGVLRAELLVISGLHVTSEPIATPRFDYACELVEAVRWQTKGLLTINLADDRTGN